MKKYFYFWMLWAFLFVTFGCSEGNESPFGEYHIENIQGIDLSTLKQEDVYVRYAEGSDITKTCFYGLKNNKIWLAIFNKETKELLVEYCFKDKIPQSVSLPYGETFEVVDWALDVYECGNLIVVDGSYSNVELVDGGVYTSDSFMSFSAPVFMNNEFVSLSKGVAYPFWFENSHILVVDGGYLLVKSDGNSILLKDIPSQEYVPISYTMAFHNAAYILYFHDLCLGDRFFVEINELNVLLQNKETDRNHINFLASSVVNDKEVEVVCNVTFKTGEKKEYLIKVSLLDKTYVWKEK